MKHHFLLDENILHHAVRGVDRHDNPDLTSSTLILFIARNCHRIILNDFLRKRYQAHLEQLKSVKSQVFNPLFLVTQLVYNSSKFIMQYDNPPRLPSGCDIPAEDVDVVRAALISHPIFVSAEEELRTAINNCEALHLRAIDAGEALHLAQET